MTEYAGAHITLLNRADASIERVAVYPITRILLLSLDTRTCRDLTVLDGQWVIGEPYENPIQPPEAP